MNNDKKKMVKSIIALIMIFAVAIIGNIHIKNIKYDKAIELGINYIREEKYEEAVLAFESAVYIDSKKTEAYDYRNVSIIAKDIKTAYENEDYAKVLELIESLDGMKYVDSVLDNINIIKQELESRALFDGKIRDVSNLKIVDTVYSDINNDRIDDRIVMYAPAEDMTVMSDVISASDIVIYDGKNDNVLTSFDGVFGAVKFSDIQDVTDDGVKDILLDCNNGAKRGGFVRILIYKDGTYVDVDPEAIEGNIRNTLLNGFKLQIEAENNPQIKAIYELNQSSQQDYISYNFYTQDGIRTNKNKSEYSIEGNIIDEKIRGGYLADYNNDGKYEYIETSLVGSWEMANAESIGRVNKVFKFVDGKFIISSIFVDDSV